MPGPRPKPRRRSKQRRTKFPRRSSSGYGASSDPLKFASALAWFRSRVPVTDREYSRLEDEVRRLAFRVAGVTQLEVVSTVWAALERAMAEGTDFRTFKADIAETLEESWGGEIPGRLETIFRTNLQNAYSAGRYQEQYSPEARADRPYVRLDTVEDSRESDICEALNGLGAFPKDGSFIASHHPPLHFNCRTTEVDLSEDEARAMGIEGGAPDVAVDDGFGGVPSFGWRPDLDSYPDPLRRIAVTKGREGSQT